VRLFVRWDAALYVQRNGDPWTNVASDPHGVTRHVHQGTQERRDAHVLERRCDHLVVIGKRLGRVGVTSHSSPFATETAGPARRITADAPGASRTADTATTTRARRRGVAAARDTP
jgi:hypothetical protein